MLLQHIVSKLKWATSYSFCSELTQYSLFESQISNLHFLKVFKLSAAKLKRSVTRSHQPIRDPECEK